MSDDSRKAIVSEWLERPFGGPDDVLETDYGTINITQTVKALYEDNYISSAFAIIAAMQSICANERSMKSMNLELKRLRKHRKRVKLVLKMLKIKL